jgi:hypothetical protein
MINWISVDEKMPEHEKKVLLFGKDENGKGVISEGCYDQDFEAFYDFRNNYFTAGFWAELSDINLPDKE